MMSSVRQAQFRGGQGFPIRSLEVILHLSINRGKPSEILKKLVFSLIHLLAFYIMIKILQTFGWYG